MHLFKIRQRLMASMVTMGLRPVITLDNGNRFHIEASGGLSVDDMFMLVDEYELVHVNAGAEGSMRWTDEDESYVLVFKTLNIEDVRQGSDDILRLVLSTF